MSADEAGQREVAYRLFAAEYDDTDYSYSESDEERAPNYVVTPTGARVNRLFVVGVLTAVERVNDDMLRGRVADPTGAFVLYAGQYQPDEQAFLERVDPPAFVAVTGKARTFEPEDGDRVYTSVRPESINAVDAETRDRWILQAAEQTLTRVGHAATALSTGLSGGQLRERLHDRGIDPGVADGITRALAHYGTTPTYLDGVRELALDAVRVVAGERDEVREFRLAPDEPGDVTAADLLAALPDGQTADPGRTEAAAATETAVGGTATETAELTGTGEDTDGVETGTTDDPGGTEAGSGTTGEAGSAATAGDPGEFDPGEFDLSEDVRNEVESEYGTDFQSGTEVDEPGEADMPTLEEPVDEVAEPAPDLPADDGEPADDNGEAAGAGEPDATDRTAATGEDDGTEGSVDPQEAVLAVMAELDDGSGADRAALVGEATERHGLTEAAVEEAIQGALMDGQCYEPDESSLKPI